MSKAAGGRTSANELARALEGKQREIERLRFLVEASELLNSTLELEELLSLILKIATEQTAADRGTVFLMDAGRNELWSLVAHGLGKQEIRLPLGQGIAGSVAQTGEVVNLNDAYADPRFDRTFDERFNYCTRTLLCLPICDKVQKTVGVLQLLNKKDTAFTERDIEFLQALSIPAALALENARLHREAIEKQRLEKELALARGIQRRLLPERAPVVKGFDIGVRHDMTWDVGGDYYDFLTLGENTLLLVVADVEGKGVASALIMSNLQASLRSLVLHLHALEDIVTTLNQMIMADTKSQKFMTMFLGLVDTRRKGLHYINAGHVPPLVVRAEGEAVPLMEGGMVVGLFPNVEYQRGFVRLQPGDVILACTDGIVEAADAQDEQYESERLVELVRRTWRRSAQEIVEAIFDDVAKFSAGGSHTDDKVMMVIRVL
ncbi:MAG: PP2C family protein-serine/threonine phosphatase [Terriglobia bacterium]